MEMPEEQPGCLGLLLDVFFGPTLMLLLVVAVLL